MALQISAGLSPLSRVKIDRLGYSEAELHVVKGKVVAGDGDSVRRHRR